MKHVLLLISILFLFTIIAKGQIVESFDDGEFISNPTWYGELSKFEIVNPPTSGDGSLNATANNDGKVLRSKVSTGDAVLTLANTYAYGQWSFSLADGYNWSVSGTNDYFVILMSNDSLVSNLKDGTLNFNGYFLRFDGNNSDTYVLYRQTGTTSTPILLSSYPTTVDGATAVGRSIKIVRTELGEWSLFIDNGFDVEATSQRGASVVDSTHTTSSWFGISTNIANSGLARVVYFDRLYIGDIIGDTTKPVIDSLKIANSRSVQLYFSEELEPVSAELISNYLANNGLNNPDSAVLDVTGRVVTLYFANSFGDATFNQLIISNVSDLSNNVMENTLLEFTYQRLNIVSVNVVSENELRVTFSDFPEISSAENTANYTVNNGIGNPFNAGIDGGNSKIVNLVFSSSFASGSIYELSISNIEDNNGDTILSVSYPFTYFVLSPYDIVVNEIMADPNPVVMLPDAEYVELYNTTSFDVSISGWTITTGTTIRTIPATTIPANNYIIICSTANVDLFQPFGNAIGAFTSATALTNTGTSVVVKNETGLVIDSVFYSDTWYQDAVKKNGGWSLEKIDPLNNCNPESNWIASNNTDGGTPGQINSVFATNTDLPPQITSVSVIDYQNISVLFSENVSAQFAEKLENYHISSIGEPISLTFSSNSAILTLAVNLVPGENYVLTIDTLADVCSNYSYNLQFPFNYVPVQQFDVIINEIMADPTPVVLLPDAEFVELHNTTSNNISINNWTITTGTTVKTIPTSIIPANGYLIICPVASTSLFQGYDNVVGVFTSSTALTNAGTSVILKNETGSVIDSVYYSDTWYLDPIKKGGGWTLERIDPYNNCSAFSNWVASNNENGGTPGTINSVYAINTDTPPIVESVIANDSKNITVYFSENISLPYASQLSNYLINGIGNPLAIINNQNSVKLTFQNSMTNGQQYSLQIDTLMDMCNLYSYKSGFEFTFIAVQQFDVVINEIMADPSPVVLPTRCRVC
jgi:hypothetical protein